jgi:hypothetical protein
VALEECALECGESLDTNDETVYKEVAGWVHGKKKDSLTLRSDTGRYAHADCVQKVKDGQDPSQPSMFDD